ncbi:MAG: UDP-N-acetylmuramate--L-alanine ligase, partial [Candidatus Omnitrophota bacterium]|nr:UDP-N-acetylmuramate--L-alanine ligase [Candidatus Omnitrophota bacterium]
MDQVFRTTMNNHYHLIGIGGIGMGALASLLLAKGQQVSGSDLAANSMTQRLQREGATISIGHAADNVGSANIVVYSSAIRMDNPELQVAKKKNIPMLPRARVLAELMQDHIGITVAGAHGKTTTTSMISHLLMDAGLNPTTAIGGIVNGTNTNALLGKGKYFVAEVDESDGSFLNFTPRYSVITNIDREHMDYYHSMERVLSAYRQFIDQTKKDGIVVAYGEDPYLPNMLKASKRSYITYGLEKTNTIYANKITFDQFTSRFQCVYQGKPFGNFHLNVPGRHNILNALACIGVGIQLSIDFDTIDASLEKYRGVKRRFEIKGKFNNTFIVDDYAHHPTEILSTLAAARLIGAKRVVAVFQPHRYSRVQSLFNEFSQCFSLCDALIVTDIYAASEMPIEGITAQGLAQAIQSHRGKNNHTLYQPKDKLVEA